MAGTVVFDGVRISTADANTDGGNWNKYASSQNPSDEVDFILGGVQELSNKISNSTGGLELTATTPVDYSTTPRVVMPKFMVSTTGLLDLTVTNALSYFVGSTDDTADFYEYRYFGTQAAYPTDRTWLDPLIDPNIAGYRHISNGTPALATIDYYAVYIDTSVGSTVKSENIIHSNLDYFDVGAGLTMTGTDGVFLDFVVEDEDSVDATPSFDNRWRLAYRIYGSDKILGANGTWTLGTATSLTFSDLTPQTITWPGGFVGTGTHGLAPGLQNASTVIAIASKSFVSDGRKSITRWFDTALEVDGTNDEIDITAHGYETGDYVTYTDEGGADTIGLTDTNSYWVSAVTADAIAFHTTRELALTAGTKVVLTAAIAPGENHKLVKADDSRAHYTVTGTTATVPATTNSCTFDNFEKITLTSKNTMDSNKFVGVSRITPASGTLTTCTIDEPFLDEGDYCVDTTDLADLTSCIFNSGDEGHAVRITTAGAYSYSGNTHTSYGPNRAQFHTISGVDAATEVITTKAVHGFTTGDAVYYSNHGGPDTVGLTSGNKYYVNAVSTTTLTMHVTRAAAVAGSSDINLSDGTAGEIHSLYSAKAALLNSIAAVLVSSYAPSNQSTSFNLFGGTTEAVAQSFAATAGVLSRVRFYLKKTGAPTGNVVAKLYAHSGTFGTSSVPTGAALATSKTFDVAELETTNYAMVDFEFDDRFSLVAATNYVIAVEFTGGDVSNTVDLGADNTAAAHGGNSSFFDSASWTAISVTDCIFYVYRGGEVVVNIAGGGDTPTYRNSGSPPGVTIVNASVTLTVTVKDEAGAAVENARVGIFAGAVQLMNELTTAAGIATEGYSGSTPVAVVVKVRKGSAAPKYIPVASAQTVTTSGLDVTITVKIDDNNAT